ncbi:MAG: hypothetical protein PF542_00225 [Nanoarchaeota archaeon]|jgi:hypothetical protein|nr:hypothetical protein [Nanoarchaeota archaeon]
MKKKVTKRNLFKRGNNENSCNSPGHMGGFYFLGFIGSTIYYIQQSTEFWPGILGALKALVWPAFLVYKLLGLN